jgi:hypothetical protein
LTSSARFVVSFLVAASLRKVDLPLLTRYFASHRSRMARWLASTALLAAAASSLARAAIVVRDGKLSLIDAVGASAVATTACVQLSPARCEQDLILTLRCSSRSFTSDSPSPLPARQLSPTDAVKLSFTVLNDSTPFAPQQAAVLVQPVNEEERKEPGRDWTSWVKVRQNSGKARWDLVSLAS